MSIEKVRDYFRPLGRDGDILEFPVSSATVELAAQAVGVIPARIAKTLSFLVEDRPVLIVAAGDAKIDNPKYKTRFRTKAKMLSPEQVVEFTGHAIGGVCPFAVDPQQVTTYLDESLKRFQTVFPAAGSSNSAIELTMEELERRVKEKGAMLIQLQSVNDAFHEHFYKKLGFRTASNLVLKTKMIGSP